MARAIEIRGRDATGVCLVGHRGVPRVIKSPHTATEFFQARKGLGANARTAMVHTRFGTQGKETNPLNNHPVEFGRLIGIHNGMIDNDFELFREHKWHRHGEVDSEAIFAAIDHLGIIEGLEAVEGSMAVAFVDRTEPDVLWLARGDSSPLFCARYLQGIFFASTKQTLTQFGDPTEMTEMAEGDLFKIRAGHIEEKARFKPKQSSWMGGRFAQRWDWEIHLGDRVRKVGDRRCGTVTEVWPSDSYTVRWDDTEETGFDLISSDLAAKK